MKLAVFSESSADEAGLRILVQGVLGRATEDPGLPSLRARGWPSVINLIPTVMLNLHFHSDAEALVVVADSDDTTPHAPNHANPAARPPDCRHCNLTDKVAKTYPWLKPVTGKATLKVAIGLAVPAIEGWWLCGKDRHVTEAAWINGRLNPPLPYDRNELKRRLYGTDRPSVEIETQHAVEEARRLAQEIRLLQTWFPGGFEPLRQSIGNW